jgi:hypothetical protein
MWLFHILQSLGMDQLKAKTIQQAMKGRNLLYRLDRFLLNSLHKQRQPHRFRRQEPYRPLTFLLEGVV